MSEPKPEQITEAELFRLEEIAQRAVALAGPEVEVEAAAALRLADEVHRLRALIADVSPRRNMSKRFRAEAEAIRAESVSYLHSSTEQKYVADRPEKR